MGFIGKICEFNNDVSFACGRLLLTEGNPVAEVGYEAKEKRVSKELLTLVLTFILTATSGTFAQAESGKSEERSNERDGSLKTEACCIIKK